MAPTKNPMGHLGLETQAMMPMTTPFGLILDTQSLRSSVSVPNLGMALNMQPMGGPPPMPPMPNSALHPSDAMRSSHLKELSGSSAGSSLPALTRSSDSVGSSVAGPSSEALVRNSSSQSAQSDYSMTNKLAANRALSVEGFPSRSAFRSVHMAYLTKISFRRDKSLVTPAMYDAVAWYLLCRADGREEAIRQLGLEEDTSKGEREREAFKRWCIRTFRLGPGIMPHGATLPAQLDKQTVLERSALVATTCPGGYSIISVADGKPVAPPAQLYGVLVFCHKRTGHGGRDKTHAFLRKYFANVPKELVQAFIKMCPTCNFKRNRDAPFQDSIDGDIEASSESAPPSSPPASAPLVLHSAEQWQLNTQSIAPGLHLHHPVHYHPSHHKAPGTLTSPPSLAELQMGTLTSPPSLQELQIGTLTSPPSISDLSDAGSLSLSGAVAVSEGNFTAGLMNAQAHSTYIAPDFNLGGFSSGLGAGLDSITSAGFQLDGGSGLLTPSQFPFMRPNALSGSAATLTAPPESLQQRLTALALNNNNQAPMSSCSPAAAHSMLNDPTIVDWSSMIAQFDEYPPGSASSNRSMFWTEGAQPSSDAFLGEDDPRSAGGAAGADVDGDVTLSA
ncbi:hypothetical protein OC846_002325 [Tilletia horrida]|uniref:Integrase zinc-binding domain-containing protein n=1 Tax=Tilletia horrida TaxID=155126 RepID=A0AAN6GUM7_9BASI|nr:hypothetical protein OC846_002325 [Tilletia horrida]